MCRRIHSLYRCIWFCVCVYFTLFCSFSMVLFIPALTWSVGVRCVCPDAKLLRCLLLVTFSAKPAACRDNDPVRISAAEIVCLGFLDLLVVLCLWGVFTSLCALSSLCVHFLAEPEQWAACTVWVFDDMCEQFSECVFLVWCVCFLQGGSAGRHFEGGQTAAFHCPRG